MPACGSSISLTPHFTDRVAEAQQLVGNRARTPELADADRELLSNTLRSLTRAIGDRGRRRAAAARRAAPGQRAEHEERAAVHRPRDVLPRTCRVRHRPCARRSQRHYPGADQDLLRECRILMLAMVTAWRWDRDDQLPNGRHWAQSGSTRFGSTRARHRLGSGVIPEHWRTRAVVSGSTDDFWPLGESNLADALTRTGCCLAALGLTDCQADISRTLAQGESFLSNYGVAVIPDY